MDFLFWSLVLAIVMFGVIAAFAIGRWWPLLIPLPAGFAAAAWRGWEFSGIVVHYVIGIAVLGYLGLAFGLVLRRVARRR